MQEMQEMQVWSLAQEDSLEKEMATLSSILPGKSHGQRSLEGCQREGHDLATKQQQEEKHILIIILQKGNAKECSNYRTVALISYARKSNAQNSPSQASTVHEL